MKSLVFINGPYDGLEKDCTRDEVHPPIVLIPINRSVLYAMMGIETKLTTTSTVSVYYLKETDKQVRYIFNHYEPSTDEQWKKWCEEVMDSLSD